MGCKMKNKISLFTIIIILTLSAGAISTPTSQPPQQTTPYRVDKIWHLGTLNFTVGSLFVYNVNFSDGQLEFTIEDIPRNISMIKIPAEITCNPKFISSFSLPVYIHWYLEDSKISPTCIGAGSIICFPNGKILSNPSNCIGVDFPENKNNHTIFLGGHLSLSLLYYISIPSEYNHYTLHMKRK